MFPSQNQFKISEDNKYQKIFGKRNIVFNPTENAMVKHYCATKGNSEYDYEPDPNVFFYGGNVIRFADSILTNIYPNWDLKNHIMSGSIYEKEIPMFCSARSMGEDPLCPIKYDRLYFGNFIITVGQVKFMMHIMHPINGSPLTNDPRRQLCIYISADRQFNSYIEPIGCFNDQVYYPVIHKHELGEELYSQLIESINKTFTTNLRTKNIIFNKINSRLVSPSSIGVDDVQVNIETPMDMDCKNLKNRNVSVLGGQTLETCSMLWMHVHVLLDCDIK